MRKITRMLAAIMLLSAVLTACRSNIPQDTNGVITTTVPATTAGPATTMPATTVPGSSQPTGEATGSVAILEAVWARFGENEKFSTYGGSIENAVTDAPGPLNMAATEELTGSYLLPADKLGSISEGASLVHMMNANIFTAVVVKVAGGDVQPLFESWRDAIQSNRWICGQPDRLLMAVVDEGYLLMSFGGSDAMNLFQAKLAEVVPQVRILYNEAIVS
jgi:hypothetical protein